MRHFQRTDRLPDALVEAVQSQTGRATAQPATTAPTCFDPTLPVLVMTDASSTCGNAFNAKPTPGSLAEGPRTTLRPPFRSTVDLRLLSSHQRRRPSEATDKA